MIFRKATNSDVDELHRVDDACFPEGDVDRERAADGEIETGVDLGRVLLCESEDEVVGFLQFDVLGDRHLYLQALAVHRDFQRHGVGRGLVRAMLSDPEIEDGTGRSISTVTSPRNTGMLRLLFSLGFVVRSVLPDYFGPGKDRFYCQLRGRQLYVDPDDCYLIPSDNLPHLYGLLGSERYTLTGLLESVPAGNWMFEVSRFEEDDIASLQSDEAGSGIGFCGGILASLTFLLGFAFVSDRFPGGARALLTIATLVTTGALIMYANATGELSRVRTNRFEEHMEWGNVLSEYGGVLPLALVLPLTFDAVANEHVAAILMSVLFAAGILAYEFSPFSMLARHPRTPIVVVPAVLTALLPIIGTAIPSSATWAWAWTVAAILLLALRVVVVVPGRVGERHGAISWEGRSLRQ